MSNISFELQEAKNKLAAREKARDHMKEVNALIRKHKGNNEVITPLLIAMGIPASKAHELLNPRYSYESKGYQGWELSNNGAEIRRLTDRVKMLESKEQTRTEIATTEGAEQPEKVINGVRIVTDYEADRVQLFFDGKPAENIRTECKCAGFKWAPSAGAWQRKINNAAIYQAERIAKLMPPPARDEAPAAEITPRQIFEANQVLTVAIAESLKGKTIATTAPEYHMNTPHVNIITIGEIVSDWDDAARRPYPDESSPRKFNNFQEYWASYMTTEQIDEMRTRLVLFGTDGSRHHVAHTKYYNFYPEPTFTGSDADREVYYFLLDLPPAPEECNPVI